MINLIKMDFGIYKSSFIFILVYAVFFASVFNSVFAVGTVPVLCVYMLVMSGLAAEETDSVYLLHKSLPVTAGEIVGAKYAEAVTVYVISFVLTLIASVFIGRIKELLDIGVLSVSIGETAFLFICLLSVTLIMVSVMLPMVYKFGYSKGRLIITIVWFAAAFALPNLLAAADINGMIESYVAVCAIALAAAAAAVIVSFKISVKYIKENKLYLDKRYI